MKFVNWRSLLVLAFLFFILSQNSPLVKAVYNVEESYSQNQSSTPISYTGNVENTDYGASSGSGESASATVELRYVLGSLIAIKLPNPGENNLTLFNNNFRIPSSKYTENNQGKIFEDLISNDLADASRDTGELDFFVHGLLFSTDKQFASMGVSTSNPGSIDSNAIKLTNFSTGSEVECDIEVRFRRINFIASGDNIQRIRPTQALVNFNRSFFNENGFAMLAIRGKVHPISVTTSNLPGTYIGNLTVSITSI